MCSASEGIVADKIREDTSKIQIVMQYLESRGLMRSLAQIEEETGLTYMPMSLSAGGILDTLIDSMEAAKGSSIEVGEISPLPSPGECATSVVCKRDNIHGGMNPTSVVWSKYDSGKVFTGGVDGKIFQWKWDNEQLTQQGECWSTPSPVLFLDSSPDGFVVASCMGGEVLVYEEGGSRDSLCVLKPHGTNRVTCVQFSPDGKMIASFGRDIAVSFTARQNNGDWGEIPEATIRYEREISAICWISNDMIAVAETGNCMIGVYRITDSCRMMVGELCMNKSVRDPRSSYSMLTMTYHEEHRLLAGCTSRNSAILFTLPEKLKENDPVCPIKTYYGMSLGLYDFPSIMFSVDGSFLYITSDKELLVFEAKTCHKVFSVNGSESKPIRCVSRMLHSDVLATVSFDKYLYVIS